MQAGCRQIIHASDETAAMPAKSATDISLHKRIRSAIEQHILTGEWPPGHKVPVEHELMATYGCSRMTVNKVLTELASEGLVQRRRRAGTFVSKPRPPATLLQIPDVKAEILALGAPYALRMLSRDTRLSGRNDMRRLSVETPRQVLALRCVHMAGSAPFALEDRLIDLSTVPEAGRESFATDPPGTWLLAHVPWSDAEHCIRAINADPEITGLLDLPPNAACLVLDRQTWRGGAPITAARTWFPAESFHLVARFQPGSNAGKAHNNRA